MSYRTQLAELKDASPRKLKEFAEKAARGIDRMQNAAKEAESYVQAGVFALSVMAGAYGAAYASKKMDNFEIWNVPYSALAGAALVGLGLFLGPKSSAYGIMMGVGLGSLAQWSGEMGAEAGLEAKKKAKTGYLPQGQQRRMIRRVA